MFADDLSIIPSRGGIRISRFFSRSKRKKGKKFPINDRIIKLFRVVSFASQRAPTRVRPFFFFLLFSLSSFFFLLFLRSSVTFSQSVICSRAERLQTFTTRTESCTEIKRGGLIGGKKMLIKKWLFHGMLISEEGEGKIVEGRSETRSGEEYLSR